MPAAISVVEMIGDVPVIIIERYDRLRRYGCHALRRHARSSRTACAASPDSRNTRAARTMPNCIDCTLAGRADFLREFAGLLAQREFFDQHVAVDPPALVRSLEAPQHRQEAAVERGDGDRDPARPSVTPCSQRSRTSRAKARWPDGHP